MSAACAHASYLIGDGGEAVVVDPSRDVQMYLDEAAAHGLTIRWILETHLHADFVSGHRDLKARTGATIAIGAKAEAGYPHRALHEGDEIRVGDVVLRAMETPGHTPESLCFVVFAHAGDPTPWAVLTGDTLFVGDVGRVDILSSRLPVSELAGLMYDSLHGKLLELPDETRVYPAHGAGSLCGRSISQERWSTIGREREMNVALADHGREAFIAEITRDVPETPVYFLHSRDLNKAGPSLEGERDLPPALTPGEAKRADDAGCRAPRRARGPGVRALSSGGSAPCEPRWTVRLVGGHAGAPGPGDRAAGRSERAEEAVMRLARVGYERVVGILEGGCDAWCNAGLPHGSITEIDAADLAPGAPHLLDVRRPAEWELFHVAGAVHVPLARLSERLADLDSAAEWTLVCASGYRSLIAASLLRRSGFARVRNVRDGMDAYQRAGLPVESGVPAQ